jgi:tetratricopeptide (TPR) repeat protein
VALRFGGAATLGHDRRALTAPTPPDPPATAGHEPDPGGADAGGPAALGTPPVVAGRDAIRARAFARLFGGEPPPASASSVATQGRTGPIDGETPKPIDGEAPTQIGRFRVDERLGGGGMGVVWAAWDPELARKVAIKVLRPDLEGAAGTVGHARLLREAQAMARINHPHVIAVHEVGSLGAQVFIAMEFVEGTTLGGWLSATKRTWREILAAFLDAGAGVAAAHAAGVVHRDFKPDNVLVGDDGRVRVVDFGLARSAAEAVLADDAAPPRPEPEGALTRTGALMGTPAYMSPEQWLGRPADARSDQFSFCVALFEALYGSRPFRATTIPDLARAVTTGPIAGAAGDIRLPRWVDAALRRGLSRDPSERFPAMADLLAALRRDPARRWRRAGAVTSVAILASAATWWTVRDDAVHRCDAVDAPLVGVWDDATRARVHDAIAATGAPFAERTWESTTALLDDAAARWSTAAGEACAAAVAGRDGGDPRRERCLDARIAELGALTELLGQADIGIALQAVDAAARLPDPQVCADPRRLATYREAPDAASRDRAAQARATLGRAGAAGAVGHYDDAIAQADAVVHTAGELDDPALEAAALLVRGQNELASGEAARGEQTLRAAVAQAEVADDHATRAQALTHLVFLVGQDPARFAEARALGADAGAVLRTIDADPLLRAQLEGALGVAAKRAGDRDLALTHHRAALTAMRELYGDDHPATLRAMGNLANALREDDPAEAEALLTQATAGLERVLGDHHPAVATSLSNLAIAVARRDRPAEAVELMRRSLAIRERNDPGHPSIAAGHFNLARALYDSRADTEALAQYREGLALRRAAAPDDPALASYYAGIGRCAVRLGDTAAAREAFEAQLRIEERQGPAAASADEARLDLARTLIAVDLERAKGLVDRVTRGLDDRPASPKVAALRTEADAVAKLVDALVEARRIARP